MEHRINWKNLRKNCCPKCASSLVADPSMDVLKCSNITCGFVITSDRFKEICGSMNKQALDVPMYRNGAEVEDLQKYEKPLCGFCHERHDIDASCEGFA